MKLGIAMFWRLFVAQSVLTFVLVIALHSTPLFAEVTYVKWKPTVVFAFLAALVALWLVVSKSGPLYLMRGKSLSLPLLFWRAFTVGLVVLFTSLSAANLAVAYFATTVTWIQYKTFGPLLIELGFCIFGAPYLAARSSRLTPVA